MLSCIAELSNLHQNAIFVTYLNVWNVNMTDALRIINCMSFFHVISSQKSLTYRCWVAGLFLLVSFVILLDHAVMLLDEMTSLTAVTPLEPSLQLFPLFFICFLLWPLGMLLSQCQIWGKGIRNEKNEAGTITLWNGGFSFLFLFIFRSRLYYFQKNEESLEAGAAVLVSGATSARKRSSLQRSLHSISDVQFCLRLQLEKNKMCCNVCVRPAPPQWLVCITGTLRWTGQGWRSRVSGANAFMLLIQLLSGVIPACQFVWAADLHNEFILAWVLYTLPPPLFSFSV